MRTMIGFETCNESQIRTISIISYKETDIPFVQPKRNQQVRVPWIIKEMQTIDTNTRNRTRYNMLNE